MTAQRKAQRRRIRFQGESSASIYSLTQPGRQVEYHPIINLESGTCSCDCPDWRIRGRRAGILCKHIKRLAVAMVRKARAA